MPEDSYEFTLIYLYRNVFQRGKGIQFIIISIRKIFCFNKILKFAPLAIVENMDVTVREQELAVLEKIDYETGEVLTEETDSLQETVDNLDKSALYKLFEIFGDEITLE